MKKTLNWVNNNKHILKNFFRLQWKRTRFSEIQNNPPPHATNSLRINSRNVNSLILSLFFFSIFVFYSFLCLFSSSLNFRIKVYIRFWFDHSLHMIHCFFLLLFSLQLFFIYFFIVYIDHKKGILNEHPESLAPHIIYISHYRFGDLTSCHLIYHTK